MKDKIPSFDYNTTFLPGTVFKVSGKIVEYHSPYDYKWCYVLNPSNGDDSQVEIKELAPIPLTEQILTDWFNILPCTSLDRWLAIGDPISPNFIIEERGLEFIVGILSGCVHYVGGPTEYELIPIRTVRHVDELQAFLLGVGLGWRVEI